MSKDVIIYFLLAINVILVIVSYIERKDLYTRLMCKDVHEYTSVVAKNELEYIRTGGNGCDE